MTSRDPVGGSRGRRLHPPCCRRTTHRSCRSTAHGPPTPLGIADAAISTTSSDVAETQPVHASMARRRSGGVKYRLSLVLLLTLALALSNLGVALGQAVDPSLAGRPPDDVTDPPPLFIFEQYPPSVNDNVFLQWDEELLQAVRALPPGPTVTARAISVVHTAMFDAWAAYDAYALGARLRGSLRRPAAERTLANKNKAISFAAYKALVDLFPARESDFAEQMTYLGYAVDESDTSTPGKGGQRRRPGGARLPPRRWVQPAQRLCRHHRLQAGQHRRHGGRPLALAAHPGAAGGRPRAAGHHPAVVQGQGVRAQDALPVRRSRSRPAAEQLRSQAHRQPARPDLEPQ